MSMGNRSFHASQDIQKQPEQDLLSESNDLMCNRNSAEGEETLSRKSMLGVDFNGKILLLSDSDAESNNLEREI